MTKSFSAAIVGAGMIAGGYDEKKRPGERGVFTHAGAYRADKRFSLRTVCDVDGRKARAFQKAWKVPYAAESLDGVLRSFHDVVSVCVPDRLHFSVTEKLLKARCCRAIFLEKPAGTRGEIEKLLKLSRKARVPVVVDFQRRFEKTHEGLRRRSQKTAPLAVNAYYIKGLRHIGATMIDTLIFLFGRPRAALAFDAVKNKTVGEPTVDFALFFKDFTATVRGADPKDGGYAHHVFEVDAIFADGRVTLGANSRAVAERNVGAYAYGGVRALGEPRVTATGYDRALVDAMEYLHSLLKGRTHRTNRLEDSYNGALVLEAVERSLASGRRVPIPEERWKP